MKCIEREYNTINNNNDKSYAPKGMFQLCILYYKTRKQLFSLQILSRGRILTLNW